MLFLRSGFPASKSRRFNQPPDFDLAVSDHGFAAFVGRAKADHIVCVDGCCGFGKDEILEDLNIVDPGVDPSIFVFEIKSVAQVFDFKLFGSTGRTPTMTEQNSGTQTVGGVATQTKREPM